MDGSRTFSFAGSIAAVSWRVAHDASTGTAADLAVVAEPDRESARLVAVLTVRVPGRGARARLAIDGRHLQTFRLLRPTRLPGVPDDLHRHIAIIPAAAVLDARTHHVSLVVEDVASEDGAPVARVETAFYASRMIASRMLPVTKPANSARGS